MKTFYGMALFLFVGFSALTAQQPTVLSLPVSVQLALENNVDIISARYDVEASQSASRAAMGGLLPSVDASAGFSRQQNWSAQEGGTVLVQGIPISVGGTAYNARNSFSTGVSSRVTLFNGFANTANVKRARETLEISELSRERTEQFVIFRTHQQFLSVFRMYQLLSVSEDNLKRSKRQLERISESNKVGAVALADVYRQQVQVGSDELALIQAQSNYEKAKADLLALIGVDLNREYQVDFAGISTDVDTSEFSRINRQYVDFSVVAREAISRRPDHRSTISNLDRARYGVTMARAEHYPSVGLSANYSFNHEQLGSLTDNRNLYFGLNVSLPLFTGFAAQNQVQQAHLQRKNAEEQIKQSERSVIVDLRKALLDLESAEKQVAVTQTSVKSAEMDRKIAEEKYNLGAGTLLDLLVANANYTRALSDKVNAVTDFFLAKKQMEFATGTISM